MVVDIVKKMKAEAQERQRNGGAVDQAPKHEPAHKYFVSSNWKNLLDRRPTIAPKAAAASGSSSADGGAGPNIVALDCEMVGVGPSGVRSALARLSIVDSEGVVLIDRFVLPREEVTDYRTHITGITAATLKSPKVLREEVAIQRAAELLSGKVVVGHSVGNDFQVLMLSHPHAFIRDTALFRPLRPPGREKKMPSLQGLAAHWLHENIHSGHHDSVEDARVALRLYRLKSRLWEKQMRSVMQHANLAGGGDAAGSAAAVEESDDEGERIEPEQCRPQSKSSVSLKTKKGKVKKKGKTEEAVSESAQLAYKNPGKKQRKRLKAAQQD